RDPAVRGAVLAYYRALVPRLTRPREAMTTWRLLSSPPELPTLVVRGERDGCFRPEVFPEAVARASAHGQIELVTTASGHFPQLEATAAVTDATRAFWGGHCAAPRRRATPSLDGESPP
ncbi:MAG TPA: alpha/beta hydrolase, partial [Myxococcota bacterium]|nr:alpha/beta hydrolase [Myxococcota bacterium]